ncbi:MAG: hypothetical protein PHH07_06745 [Candidatus Cloacimonetes bacterium]|nr:hypothetical protein [Candidatus Cloacimonadota bacterium]
MAPCCFTAGTFIELDDPNGIRFIGQVSESGTEFIDIAGGGNCPVLPIRVAQNPVEIGDFRALKHALLDARPEEFAAFAGFVSDLFDALRDYDGLTVMRAVKWAFDGGNYKGKEGVARALAAADRANQEAIERQMAITAKTDLLAA